MECWAHINGKDYPIAYGWTLTDEFSETLDSSTITIPHVVGNLSIKPYDDVIIHDFGEGNLPPRSFGVSYQEEFRKQGHFYRHMLCHSFTKERVFIDRISEDGKQIRCYNYNIELVSETKGLERVQLPNKTISQPIGTGESAIYEDNVAPVAFGIGGSEYSLPYSMSNDWRDAFVMKSIPFTVTSRFYWTIFGGDMDSVTIDRMKFMNCKYGIAPNSRFALPDFNCSGITIAGGYKSNIFNIWTLRNFNTYHPKKHWIIRKRSGTQAGDWSTRENIIQIIQTYLSDETAVYPEIVNSVALQRDIHSEDAISSIYVSLPNTDLYEIYLYIEPQIVPLYDGENPVGSTLFHVNAFGMTDNTSGNTWPITGFDDGSVPFLAKWEINVSVDVQRRSRDTLSAYEAARQILELYSPYVKLCNGKATYGNSQYLTWDYAKKYRLDESVKAIFGSVNAPEIQMNYPNLRDYLTKLFYSQNCIPVVRDNVIFAMNLSSRYPLPFSVNEENMSFEQYSMDGDSYCDRLLRIYTDGLSKSNLVNCVERIGFKNDGSATLTLDNMRLELSHPIYRVSKVYMCYYNEYDNYVEQGKKQMSLCKQDITALVLLNSQRQLLSKEYVADMSNPPDTIEELSKYYFATVGYDIGSKYISGWGTKYSAPKNFFWKTERSVIENIFEFVKGKTPFGVSTPKQVVAPQSSMSEFSSNAPDDRQAIDSNGEVITISKAVMTDDSICTFAKDFGEYTQRLKSMVFIIEYQGFISSAVTSSKEQHDGNVISMDNASSSLSFVDTDGLNQKDKANRLGNASRTVVARHMDFSSIQELSSVWNSDSNIYSKDSELYEPDEEHVDEVCFKRVIAFEKDYFTVSYFLCRNYIIRNYFTSVFSKYRPFPLASYEESVERHENKTLEILFSPDYLYHQKKSNKVNFNLAESAKKLLSFYLPSQLDSAGNVIIEGGIDKSFYGVYQSVSDDYQYAGQVGFFATDLMKFMSGNSICFTIPMKDNVSAGVYVTDFGHNLGQFIGETWQKTWELISIGTISWDDANSAQESSVLLSGARQNWHMFPVDPKTGMMYSMRFAVGFSRNDIYALNSIQDYSKYDIAIAQLLPLMDSEVKLVDGTYQYFGSYTSNGKIIGAGYPIISFEFGSDGNYKVDSIDKDTVFSISDCLIERSSPFDSAKFIDAGYNEIGERERIDSFAEAVFNGTEADDEDSETDTCVFKDGKERIVTTIQFEPISEDVRVRFSPYMMKLSDAMGGKKKTYEDAVLAPNVLCMLSVSNIIANVYTYKQGYPDLGVQSYERFQSAIFSAPSLSIGFPESAIDSANFPITVNKSFATEPSQVGGPTYSLTINRIEQINSLSGEMVASVSIIMNGQTITNGSITLQDITNNQDQTINGISGQSDFLIGTTCIAFGAGYRTFAMVEDRGFLHDGSNYISFKYSNQTNSATILGAHGNYGQQNSFVKSIHRQVDVDHPGVIDRTALDFSDAKLNYSSGSYTQTEFNQDINITGYMTETYTFTNTIVSHPYRADVYYVGPKVGDGITIPKNMLWVFTPELMTIETEQSAISDISEIAGIVIGLEPDSDFGIKVNSDGLCNFYLNMPSEIKGTASVRMYYLDDDGLYHFVFGMNLGAPSQEDEQPNCIYPSQGSDTHYDVYISFLDDRSKTVIDNMPDSDTRGEPIYQVADLSDDDYPSGQLSSINVAVEK